MSGIPTPKEVEEWWESLSMPAEQGDGGADYADHADSVDHEAETAQNGQAYTETGDRHLADHQPITHRLIEEGRHGNGETRS